MHSTTLSRAALCALIAFLAACGGANEGSASNAASDGATSSSSTGSTSNSSDAGDAIVALSSTSYPVAATSTVALITVNRMGSASGTVTVDYTTVNGTATAGENYSPTSGSLVWTSGDTAPQTISVPVYRNVAHASSFGVSLTSVTGAANFGTPTTASVTISAATTGSSGSSGSGASTAPQAGLALSCPTATAKVQFAACPGGQLVYAVPAEGVYVESSTVATTGVPAYSAATHVFQPYQNAVDVVICTIDETPGLAVTYSTDPCMLSHGVVAGPAAGGGSSNSNGGPSSGSSSGGSSSVTSSGGSKSSGSSTSSSSSSSSGGSKSSASGSSGSSGGSSSGSASVPMAAQKAGYLVNTYGPNPTLKASGGPIPGAAVLYLSNLLGSSIPASEAIQNSDGSLALPGGGNSNGQVVSVRAAKNAAGFEGVAFGGGAYFEATLKFDGWQNQLTTNSTSSGFPSFWSMSIEHLISNGDDQWQGQATGYKHFIEIDFLEYDIAYPQKTTDIYNGSIHDWYGIWNKTCAPSAFCEISNNPWSTHLMSTPANTDFSAYHTYGLLWVPATDSSDGYIQYYFDGEPVGQPITWTLFNSESPAATPAAQNFGIVDLQHLAITLGTGPNFPMTVGAVSVWQKSADENMVAE